MRDIKFVALNHVIGSKWVHLQDYPKSWFSRSHLPDYLKVMFFHPPSGSPAPIIHLEVRVRFLHLVPLFYLLVSPSCCPMDPRSYAGPLLTSSLLPVPSLQQSEKHPLLLMTDDFQRSFLQKSCRAPNDPVLFIMP